MSNVHRCRLPHKEFDLKTLPPNATWHMRLRRALWKLIIANPKNFRCKTFFCNQSTIRSEQRKHIKSPYYYVIHPYSSLSAMHEVAFFVIWVIKMITDPIIEIMYPLNRGVEIVDSMVLPAFQYVLIFSFFFVGYLDMEEREVIIEHRRVMKRYARTFFVFDVGAAEALRVVLLYTLEIANIYPAWRAMKIIHSVHVICLYVRLGSVLNYLNDILHMLNLSRKMRRSIIYGLKTYMYLHLFSCLAYFVPLVVYHKKWPADSWLVAAKINPSERPSIGVIYRECFLMTICFFFGTSDGKYYINQSSEQICFCVISFFGRLYTLFMLADLLRIFGLIGMSEGNYESSFAQLKEFMRMNDLPTSLRNRIILYFEHKQQKHYFDEADILDSLSETLRNELFLYSARKLIQKSPVFRYLPRKDIATLISLMRTETFAPGNVLFKPDQLSGDVYFISSGTVAILNRDGIELCHFDDGDAFGFIANLPGSPKYTVLILETTELFAIEATKLNEFLQPFPEAANYLSEMVKERIEEYNKLEANAKMDSTNCLVELRTGKLLERKKVRIAVG